MGKYDNLAALARMGDEAGDAVRQAIRAYHGSPHDFDRFDASKIGTGEGAQAYGHGLYFAGNEAVGKAYREALKTSVDRPVPRDLQNAYIEASAARSDFANRRGGWLRKNPRIQFPQQAEMDANETLFYDLQNRVNAAAQNPGRMYEVEIGHPEDALLDWDRPFKSQGKLVSERLAPFRTYTYNLPDYATGSTALHRIASAFDSDMSEASAALFKSGIPGIRYLDHGSRSIGHGSRNYVMFPGTEDQIRILRKYAIPGAVGTGVASQYEESP